MIEFVEYWTLDVNNDEWTVNFCDISNEQRQQIIAQILGWT